MSMIQNYEGSLHTMIEKELNRIDGFIEGMAFALVVTSYLKENTATWDRDRTIKELKEKQRLLFEHRDRLKKDLEKHSTSSWVTYSCWGSINSTTDTI